MAMLRERDGAIKDGAIKFIPRWRLPPVVEPEPRLDAGAGGFHVYICYASSRCPIHVGEGLPFPISVGTDVAAVGCMERHGGERGRRRPGGVKELSCEGEGSDGGAPARAYRLRFITCAGEQTVTPTRTCKLSATHRELGNRNNRCQSGREKRRENKYVV